MSRLIGILSSGIVAVAAKYGTTLDPDTIAWVIVAVYSGVHQVVEKVRK